MKLGHLARFLTRHDKNQKFFEAYYPQQSPLLWCTFLGEL
jgi:hypothetical protein